MKHLKFSRLKLLTAVLFSVFALLFSSCVTPYDDSEDPKKTTEETPVVVTPDEEVNYPVFGIWVSPYSEKYKISSKGFRNYYGDSECYTGNHIAVKELSEDAGYIYFTYTKAIEERYSEPTGEDADTWTKWSDSYWSRYSTTAPDVGKWYAVSYKNLTENSVSFAGAAGTLSSCDSLAAAIEEFTIENGYFAYYSECTREGYVPENPQGGSGNDGENENPESGNGSGDSGSGNAGTTIDKKNWTETFTSNNETLTITATNGNLSFNFDSKTYEAPFWTRIVNMDLSMAIGDEREEMNVDEAIWIATTPSDKSPNVFYQNSWKPESSFVDKSNLYDDVEINDSVRWQEIQIVYSEDYYLITLIKAVRYEYTYYDEEYGDEVKDFYDTNEILFNLVLTPSQWDNFIRYFR